MSGIDTIIFDLGGVLIDWNPIYVYDENYFDSLEKRDHFFEHICTMDWNEQQDAGKLIVDSTNELIARHPEWQNPIRDYYGRWKEMLKGPIQPTVEIFRQLKESGSYKLYALTNWSAELFPVARERFEFLQWFDGIVVSGEEKTRKPFPEIYNLLLNRFNVKAVNAIFIDDNFRNIEAARLLGIHTIRFDNPDQLKKELAEYAIPVK